MIRREVGTFPTLHLKLRATAADIVSAASKLGHQRVLLLERVDLFPDHIGQTRNRLVVTPLNRITEVNVTADPIDIRKERVRRLAALPLPHQLHDIGSLLLQASTETCERDPGRLQVINAESRPAPELRSHLMDNPRRDTFDDLVSGD